MKNTRTLFFHSTRRDRSEANMSLFALVGVLRDDPSLSVAPRFNGLSWETTTRRAKRKENVTGFFVEGRRSGAHLPACWNKDRYLYSQRVTPAADDSP